MTAEQIQNWRKLLFTKVGLYALIMPESEIIQHQQRLQRVVNDIDYPALAAKAHKLLNLLEITPEELWDLHNIYHLLDNYAEQPCPNERIHMLLDRIEIDEDELQELHDEVDLLVKQIKSKQKGTA
jgi:hypothetical protein